MFLSNLLIVAFIYQYDLNKERYNYFLKLKLFLAMIIN